ncbi:hypothetical protein H0H93_013598 [Arthromyces matolae]|nr:hypothetical protein H0H93_013598 [Arthromyces matolae]
MLWTKASKPTALSITESGFLDLSQTSLSSDYPHTYIKVLDNLFTPEECASLVSLAESGTKDGWETAKISTYGGDVVDLDYRNSDRILRFDHETADWIYERLLPHIQDLVEIKAGDEWENVVGPRGQTTGTWKLVGMVQVTTSNLILMGSLSFPMVEERV